MTAAAAAAAAAPTASPAPPAGAAVRAVLLCCVSPTGVAVLLLLFFCTPFELADYHIRFRSLSCDHGYKLWRRDNNKCHPPSTNAQLADRFPSIATAILLCLSLYLADAGINILVFSNGVSLYIPGTSYVCSQSQPCLV